MGTAEIIALHMLVIAAVSLGFSLGKKKGSMSIVGVTIGSKSKAGQSIDITIARL